MFDNFNEYLQYKIKNPIEKKFKDDLAYLLSQKSYSGIYDLEFNGNKFKYINIGNDDFGILKFFWRGEPEYISMNFWVEACKMDGLCIDVGAHTGRYSVIGSICSKKNNIVSFEPYFLNYSRMLSNLRLNNILTNNCFFSAASSVNGLKFFNIKNKDKFFHSSSGKLVSDKDSSLKVPTLKIDSLSFKSEIKAIKIDTEGHEYEVLLGAINILKKDKPLLIIEKNEENLIQIINLLKDIDYNCYLIDDNNQKIQNLNLSNENYLDQSYKNIVCIFKNNLKIYNYLVNKYIS
tara:strand:+ start:114 stop:986 length:873 start_codon:yes stop_codon:yes gene_type:complete